MRKQRSLYVYQEPVAGWCGTGIAPVADRMHIRRSHPRGYCCAGSHGDSTDSDCRANADRCGADEAHLVIFDRTPGKAWEEKLFQRAETSQGRPITVWGM